MYCAQNTVILTKKNFKLCYCLSTIQVLSNHNIYVDVGGLAKYFDVYISSVINNKYFVQPKNSDLSIQNYLECHRTAFELNYKNVCHIMDSFFQCTEKLSSGVDKILVLATSLTDFLVHNRGINIHRACSILFNYFGVGLSTLLKHYKSVNKH